MSSNEKMVSAPKLLAADNDRGMLEYLSEGYESQVYVCEQCGHEEPLETYDLASDLREYLAAYPPAPAEQHQGEPGEVERLRAALKFYANREHYHFESGNWDTVSGEPLNILWNGDEPDMIEDGSVARGILSASKSLCSTCKGYGRYQDGDSGTDEDGRAPNIVECDCADYERMPEYRANALENKHEQQ